MSPVSYPDITSKEKKFQFQSFSIQGIILIHSKLYSVKKNNEKYLPERRGAGVWPLHRHILCSLFTKPDVNLIIISLFILFRDECVNVGEWGKRSFSAWRSSLVRPSHQYGSRITGSRSFDSPEITIEFRFFFFLLSHLPPSPSLVLPLSSMLSLSFSLTAQ